MLAVEAPVRKLAVIAGATLAIAAFAHRPHAAEQLVQTHHRMSLHAPTRSDAVYLTVFAYNNYERTECDLRSIELVTAPREALTFTTRKLMYDGCEWEGVEHLTPIDDRSYAYSYDERILECAPDAIPAYKTPRTGIVTVDD